MRRNLYAAIVATLAFAPGIAGAAELMPSFANVPTGWSTDRYNPDSFTNIGTVNGRSNVLGIGIGPNGAFANRPPAYQSQFYDTQGMGHSISGGSGNSLSAGLYIPSSWLNSANGVVRTDMWGVMNSGTFNAITDYPIIGFTNHGASGYVGLQVWDDNLNLGSGGWVELGTTIDQNAWNDLSIAFTGAAFDYYVNRSEVYSQVNDFGSLDFQGVIMQAYNFDDSSDFPGVNAVPYTANWSNTPVPEPSSLPLLCAGLVGLAVLSRFKRSSGAPLGA